MPPLYPSRICVLAAMLPIVMLHNSHLLPTREEIELQSDTNHSNLNHVELPLGEYSAAEEAGQ